MEDQLHVYVALIVLYSVVVSFALPPSVCASLHELIQCVTFQYI